MSSDALALAGARRCEIAQPAPRAHLSWIALKLLRVSVRYREETLHALAQSPSIVVANHVSLIDGVIVAMASPVPMVFSVETDFSVHSPIARFGLKLLSILGYGSVVPLDDTTPLGLRALLNSLREGRTVMMFPEGRISPDGEALPHQPGLGWLTGKIAAPVISLKIVGAHQSRLFGKRGRAWWPPVQLDF